MGLNDVPYSAIAGLSQNGNELYHYGIKGMRWGHRKDTGIVGLGKRVGKALGTKMKSIKEKSSQRKEKTRQKEISKGATDKMTDSQLRNAISRLQLQKQYKDLKAEMNPKKQKRFMGKVISNLSDVMATIPAKALQNHLEESRADRIDRRKYAREDQRQKERYKRDEKRQEAKYSRDLQRQKDKYDLQMKRQSDRYQKQQNRKKLQNRKSDSQRQLEKAEQKYQQLLAEERTRALTGTDSDLRKRLLAGGGKK